MGTPAHALQRAPQAGPRLEAHGAELGVDGARTDRGDAHGGADQVVPRAVGEARHKVLGAAVDRACARMDTHYTEPVRAWTAQCAGSTQCCPPSDLTLSYRT